MAPFFDVIYSEKLGQDYAALVHQADAVGRKDDVVRAMQTIHRQLEVDRRGFGDPLYTLRHMEVFQLVISPLIVSYGVHKTNDVVFLQRIQAAQDLGHLNS